jgi:sugar-phosphatase
MKSLQCEAIIFDLDGVLIDSTAAIERHWRQWAAGHGLDPEEIMRVAYGMRTVDTIGLVAPHLNAEEEAAHFQAGEATDTEGLVKIDGAVSLTQALPEGSWAVATSGSRDIAMTRLTHVGLPVPTVLVTADDVKRGKPDPEAYLLAAERLDVAPERCMVVEDSPAGIEAALAAGMRVVAIATTHARGELESADALAMRLSDIKVLINRHEKGSSGELPSVPLRLTLTVQGGCILR